MNPKYLKNAPLTDGWQDNAPETPGTIWFFHGFPWGDDGLPVELYVIEIVKMGNGLVYHCSGEIIWPKNFLPGGKWKQIHLELPKTTDTASKPIEQTPKMY